MVTIDWKEYKEFKQFNHREDKLQIVIDFIKNYYNKNSPAEIYSMLKNDEDQVGQMFLDSKNIDSIDALENYMFKQ